MKILFRTTIVLVLFPLFFACLENKDDAKNNTDNQQLTLVENKGQIISTEIPVEIDKEDDQNDHNFHAVSFGNQDMPNKDPLKFFGVAFTGVEGIGAQDNYFEEVCAFSNIALIQASETETVIDKILTASNYGQLSIISVADMFFEIVLDDNGCATVQLRSDYREQWPEFSDELRPYENCILGFLNLDEPYWWAIQYGIPFQKMRQMIEEVAFQIKKQFPRKKVIGTIAVTERELAQEEVWGYPLPADPQYYAIPKGYDWVAIYYYWPAHSGNFSQFEQIWEERMKSFNKHLSPRRQKIVLVPGTFSFVGLELLELEQDLIALAPWYVDMAKQDQRVVMFMPFLWPDYDCLVGMKSMPELQEVWRKIGESIVL